MKIRPYRTVLFILLTAVFASPLHATSFEQGRDAYLAKDYANALKILQPLAEQGESRAQIALAIMYEQGHGVRLDIPASIQWYEKAAAQGLPIVQHDLGVKYFSGRGIPQDYSKAVYWWTRAAKQGLVESQYNLGLMHSRGLGMARDEVEAQHWFRQAAEKGHAQAQYSLAVMYAFGQGVRKDEEKALQWFLKAAEQDMPEAQFNLAMLYENRQGAESDPQQAIHWYQKAASHGVSRARQRLRELGAEAEPVASEETPGKIQTTASKLTADNDNGIRDADWIRQQNPDDYTLQLSSSTNERGTIRFLKAYNLGGDGGYFRGTYPSGAVRFTAFYGVFKTYTEAEKALGLLPDSIKSSKPWIRKFGILQQQVNP